MRRGEQGHACATYLRFLESSFVVSLFFFTILAALMLTFMPRRLARMRRSIAEAPGHTLLLGVVGLSVLFLHVADCPFDGCWPAICANWLLAIVAACTLGYALEAYSVAMRFWSGLGGAADPSILSRLVAFSMAIICIALLNIISFVGWVANDTLVLQGIAAMTGARFNP